MLQENGFSSLPDSSSLPLDAENSKNVPILSGDMVLLRRVVEELTVVGEVQFGLWMDTKSYGCKQQNNQSPHFKIYLLQNFDGIISWLRAYINLFTAI